MSRLTLVRWELRAALQSSWFLVASVLFLVGGLALVAFGTNSSVLGARGFGRALAATAHLAMVAVPLMSLIPSAASISRDRELGNMSFLLAQPLSRLDVYASRWGGLAGALLLCVTISFGTIGAFAAARGIDTGVVLALLALTALLATAFVSLGLLVSAVSDRGSRASSLAFACWLVFVALGSLGAMTAFVRWGLSESLLRAWVLVNPVEAYRLAVFWVLGADGQTLGPVALSATHVWGDRTIAFSVASLIAWATVAGLAGFIRFRRSDF